MRPFERVVSACCVAVICAGAVYAYDRERLRDTDLNSAFQQINRESFRRELSGVTVEWSDLDQEYGETRESPTGLLILVDRNENTSIAEVRKTLQHEACHVQTRVEVEQERQDPHGPIFDRCMMRFDGIRP